jgi:hypothetical protein
MPERSCSRLLTLICQHWRPRDAHASAPSGTKPPASRLQAYRSALALQNGHVDLRYRAVSMSNTFPSPSSRVPAMRISPPFLTEQLSFLSHCCVVVSER